MTLVSYQAICWVGWCQWYRTYDRAVHSNDVLDEWRVEHVYRDHARVHLSNAADRVQDELRGINHVRDDPAYRDQYWRLRERLHLLHELIGVWPHDDETTTE